MKRTFLILLFFMAFLTWISFEDLNQVQAFQSSQKIENQITMSDYYNMSEPMIVLRIKINDDEFLKSHNISYENSNRREFYEKENSKAVKALKLKDFDIFISKYSPFVFIKGDTLPEINQTYIFMIQLKSNGDYLLETPTRKIQLIISENDEFEDNAIIDEIKELYSTEEGDED